jgi:hypothetical protein
VAATEASGSRLVTAAAFAGSRRSGPLGYFACALVPSVGGVEELPLLPGLRWREGLVAGAAQRCAIHILRKRFAQLAQRAQRVLPAGRTYSCFS